MAYDPNPETKNIIANYLESLQKIFVPLLERVQANENTLKNLVWRDFKTYSFEDDEVVPFLEDIEDIGVRASQILSEMRNHIITTAKYSNPDVTDGDQGGI